MREFAVNIGCISVWGRDLPVTVTDTPSQARLTPIASVTVTFRPQLEMHP